MSVLVTGGLGFIGAKVVIQLLKRDFPVIVADLDINISPPIIILKHFIEKFTPCSKDIQNLVI